MYRHPDYLFMLHDQAELADILGCPVRERRTLHEWPLSCVQEIHTADGNVYIYKAQVQPTVEADFYAAARSPLLISANRIETGNDTVVLIMPKIAAPKLSELGKLKLAGAEATGGAEAAEGAEAARGAESADDAEAAAFADKLLAQIHEIEGNPPVLTNIGSKERFASYIEQALDDLLLLVREGRFRKVSLRAIHALKQWSRADALTEVAQSPAVLVHGDLKADNILIAEEGCKVIDWQRPLLGPAALDKATLLMSMNVDPLKYVPPGAVQLHHFLHIAWYAAAARRWYPPGARWFDGFVGSSIRKLAALQNK